MGVRTPYVTGQNRVSGKCGIPMSRRNSPLVFKCEDCGAVIGERCRNSTFTTHGAFKDKFCAFRQKKYDDICPLVKTGEGKGHSVRVTRETYDLIIQKHLSGYTLAAISRIFNLRPTTVTAILEKEVYGKA